MTMSAHEDTNHEFENIDVVNGDSPIQKNEIVPVDKNILTGTKKNAITFTVETQSYVAITFINACWNINRNTRKSCLDQTRI